MANTTFLTTFEKEYQKLNPEQRQAVDTIEGPVMVIAGAGTGKTQTIALRIANILAKTQTPAGSILCLTFTENAASNMRTRLLSIIGERAYAVRIHTFHSFCNEVILSNPEQFIFAANLKPLDELTKIEIVQSLIEDLPDAAVLKPWGDHQYYRQEVIMRLQTLKRENVSPEAFIQLLNSQKIFVNQAKIDFDKLRALRANKNLENEVLSILDQLIRLPHLSTSILSFLTLTKTLNDQNQFMAGKAKSPAVNLKNYLLKFYDDLVKALPKQDELSTIYTHYQAKIKAIGCYDFDDMILFVLTVFRDNPDFLLQYQERFQYILVDEYQDTNSAQNQIIELLGSYFDIPNIFVVGDDDQSIFRFQGAAIENIFNFYQQQQAHLKTIVLKNNYRSHQLILDSSLSVIAHNKNRITSYIKDIDKSLTSSQKFDPDPINLYEAPSSLAENYYIVKKIQDLQKSGVAPNQIAILYRNNHDIDDLREFFEKSKIKYRLESGTNVLDNPHVRDIISLLTFIQNPTDDRELFRLLSYDFLKINPVDLFRLLRYCYHHNYSLSRVLLDEEHMEDIAHALQASTNRRLRNFRIRMAKAQRWKEIYSLDRFFNKVVRRFGFLQHLLSHNSLDELNHLNTFYDELKRLSIEEKFTLEQFLNRLHLLIENNLSLSPSPLDGSFEDAVRLMTVHKAKGLEFEHVFLIKVLDKKWGNNTIAAKIPLPLGILKTELSLLANADDSENEEERRLFYVALTRAKKQIYISYPTKSASGRDLLPSQFIHEIRPELIESVIPDKTISHEALIALFPLEEPRLFRHKTMTKFLKNFISEKYKFNVSHLNSYLKCPLCFYYKTILRIPSVKDKYASLGTAAHAALSRLFNVYKKDNRLIEKSEFIGTFAYYLKRENLSVRNYEETLKRGTTALSAYYDHYQHDFNCNCLLDYDFAKDNVMIDGIPVTGKIDKVEILAHLTDGQPDINVVDFKTGNPDSKSSELKLGSDYFRQLVFYKLLADNDPQFKYHMVSGTIDFIQPSTRTKNFIKKDYVITREAEEEIRQLIKEVYQKITALDFQPTPDCEDPDDLHRLARVA